MNRDAVRPARRQYPTPTPAPDRYNSPTTPAGTGRSHSSRTKNAAHAVGEPIGGAPEPGSKGVLAQSHIVVSVGPYTLRRLRPGAQRRTRSGETASPPTASVVSSGTSSGVMLATAAGVMNACDT